MNRRRNNRRKEPKQKNVMTRCQLLLRPVWEHEVCAEYKGNKDSQSDRNCRSCEHSN